MFEWYSNITLAPNYTVASGANYLPNLWEITKQNKADF